MSNRLLEEILGPDAAQVLIDMRDRHHDLLTADEIEAVEQYHTHPGQVTDAQRAALDEMLLSVADDFRSRKRLVDARKLALTLPPNQDEDEEWLPDDLQEMPRQYHKTAHDEEGDLAEFIDEIEEP